MSENESFSIGASLEEEVGAIEYQSSPSLEQEKDEEEERLTKLPESILKPEVSETSPVSTSRMSAQSSGSSFLEVSEEPPALPEETKVPKTDGEASKVIDTVGEVEQHKVEEEETVSMEVDQHYDTTVESAGQGMPMQIDQVITTTETSAVKLNEDKEHNSTNIKPLEGAHEVIVKHEQKKEPGWATELSAPIVYEARTRTSTHIVRHFEPAVNSNAGDSDGTAPGESVLRGSTMAPSKHKSILVGSPSPYVKPEELGPEPDVQLRLPAGRTAKPTHQKTPVPKPRRSLGSPTKSPTRTRFDLTSPEATADVSHSPSSPSPLTSLEEQESKAMSLPMAIDDHLPTASAHTPALDGRVSAQGIPEVEKKLSFASDLPRVSRKICKSDTTLPKSALTRISSTSLHTTAVIGEEEAGEQLLPLQRRNSIHNVPFVDVNDPSTRERMERYKEERRSALRAMYKVEDYKTEVKSSSPTDMKSPSAVVATPPTAKQRTSIGAPLVEPTPPASEPQQPQPAVTLRKMPVSADGCLQSNNNLKTKKTSLNSIYTPKAMDSEVTRKWSLPAANSSNSSIGSSSTSGPVPKQKDLSKFTQSSVFPRANHPEIPAVPTPKNRTSYPGCGGNNNPLMPITKSGGGLIEEDVNVRERAAMFGGGSSSNSNKPTSLSVVCRKNSANASANSGNAGVNNSSMSKEAPGSPNKIKNMAAMFEQKS